MKITMGEKIKDMRVERHLTTKQLAQQTGISEAVLNGIENDSGRDVGYSRIIELAKFFEVPTDYLLGFTESRITKNIELKALGLSDKAIEVLLAKRQDNEIISQLIEHGEFSNLINAIDIYVKQLAAKSINTINNLTAVVQRGVENYAEGAGVPGGYGEAMNYINETKVDEDEFLRYQITERFNQILRDIYNANADNAEKSVPSVIAESNEMTGFMLELLDQVKAGEVEIETPMDAVALMMVKMGVSEEEMSEVMGELLDEGDEVPQERIKQIMERYGFIQAGFEIIWANEKDHNACVTYRNNFGSNVLVEADISTVQANIIPKCDVLVAGFPCQSFSVMGYQRGFKDPRGNLFFEIAGIVDTIKPKVILLENVRNLIYHANGKTFITIFNTLAELGYEVKYSIQNASTHGNIPQERSRTIIAAFSDYDMLNAFSFSGEIPLTVSIEDILDRTKKHHDDYYYKPGNRYYDTLNRKIPDKTGIYRIDDSGVAMRKYVMSPTLKANMGTYHDRVPVIRDDFGIRKLTPYECLALQGFPKDFIFKGIPIEAAYKQCGNTVCVPVVKRIAENIIKVF